MTPVERTLPVPDNSSGSGLHLFSLPHWTRRILAVSPSPRKSVLASPHADTRSDFCSASSRRLLVEKDLPPTPTAPAGPNIAGREPCAQPDEARVSSAIQHVADAPLQSTFCLDVHHNSPVTSSPSQMNPGALTSFPSSGTENTLRKSKSTHLLRQDHSSLNERQRTRGVSMTHMLMKTRRAATSPITGNSPSTPLARKPSFWSRKVSTSSPQHLTVPPESPSLPVFKSISPFHVDFAASPDPPLRSRSNSGGARLPTRRLERAAGHPSMTHTNPLGLSQTVVSPDRSVRPSTADPYIASLRSHTRRPTTADSNPSRSRSLFTLSLQSTPPPSNNDPFVVNPTSESKATPKLRSRSSTNPPLLHRLSVNLFATLPQSAKTSLPSGVASSPASRSPRPSVSQIPPDILKPRVAESSETFVNRLASLVSKAEIVSILASAGDDIHVDSLRLFIERFGFHGDPLDVALRRLLMDVGLPRETQQIDRVIQAFADRYLSCNPDLFTSRDHPYILAFSLIMLHTDAFNKSNRRKMSKADYMKNTALPGLIPEILACFYDNIVFAPFIFIEDPLDSEGGIEGIFARPSTSSGFPSPMMQSGNTLLSRPKIDPYYLIKNNLLDQLRVNVESQIALENPLRWNGTGTSWDYDEILLGFVQGHVVQMASVDRPTAPFFGLNVGGIPTPSVSGLGGAPEMLPDPKPWLIRLAKVAVLNRKDDLLGGGKKPLNRKWRPYCVALTRSQLLLFRDLSWSTTLLSWNEPPGKPPIPSTTFKPDEIISLSDTLAVLDQSYSRHSNTFRVTTCDGRHILFQTVEEKEMNEWISLINYASAFKSAGIRMRPLGTTSKVLELAGVAAAKSHLYDLQLPYIGQPRVPTRNHCNVSELIREPAHLPRNEHIVNMDGCHNETAGISAPKAEGVLQFKETFGTVKAELATAYSDPPIMTKSPCLTSRSHMIHTWVDDLENRICAVNTEIDSSMRIARNIAILAPFQKSTRDRLQDTVQIMSKKIQAMRLDITKLMCHRNILLNDLAVEEKNFKQATSLALQAATETLQQRYSHCTSQSSISTQEHRSKSSFHEETLPTGSRSLDSPSLETFRSALDFGPDWPSSGEAFAAPFPWGPFLVTDSPTTQDYDDSTGCYPSPNETSYLSLSSANQLLPDMSHERQAMFPASPEEQAEEWSKTRAAKRVSLVKVPSDLRMTVITGQSSCRGQGSNLFTEESDVDYRT